MLASFDIRARSLVVSLCLLLSANVAVAGQCNDGLSSLARRVRAVVARRFKADPIASSREEYFARLFAVNRVIDRGVFDEGELGYLNDHEREFYQRWLLYELRVEMKARGGNFRSLSAGKQDEIFKDLIAKGSMRLEERTVQDALKKKMPEFGPAWVPWRSAWRLVIAARLNWYTHEAIDAMNETLEREGKRFESLSDYERVQLADDAAEKALATITSHANRTIPVVGLGIGVGLLATNLVMPHLAPLLAHPEIAKVTVGAISGMLAPHFTSALKAYVDNHMRKFVRSGTAIKTVADGVDHLVEAARNAIGKKPSWLLGRTVKTEVTSVVLPPLQTALKLQHEGSPAAKAHATELFALSAIAWVRDFPEMPLTDITVGEVKHALSGFFDTPEDYLAIVEKIHDLTSEKTPGNAPVIPGVNSEKAIRLVNLLLAHQDPANPGAPANIADVASSETRAALSDIWGKGAPGVVNGAFTRLGLTAKFPKIVVHGKELFPGIDRWADLQQKIVATLQSDLKLEGKSWEQLSADQQKQEVRAALNKLYPNLSIQPTTSSLGFAVVANALGPIASKFVTGETSAVLGGFFNTFTGEWTGPINDKLSNVIDKLFGPLGGSNRPTEDNDHDRTFQAMGFATATMPGFMLVGRGNFRLALQAVQPLITIAEQRAALGQHDAPTQVKDVVTSLVHEFNDVPVIYETGGKKAVGDPLWTRILQLQLSDMIHSRDEFRAAQTMVNLETLRDVQRKLGPALADGEADSALGLPEPRDRERRLKELLVEKLTRTRHELAAKQIDSLASRYTDEFHELAARPLHYLDILFPQYANNP